MLTSLAEADPGLADMSTLVLIGSSETRLIARARGAPVAADAANLRSGAMSLDPGQSALRASYGLDRIALPAAAAASSRPECRAPARPRSWRRSPRRRCSW